MDLSFLDQPAASVGLSLRGGLHPAASDGMPALPDGRPVATLVLLGFVGRSGWDSFAAAPEAADGQADPLDRWSSRIIGALAMRFEAIAVFPFGGPPYLPFGRWAQRAEPVHPSPLGLLIHPDWGLWHSYRGALGFAERLDLPAPDRRASPCIGCARPCLTTCPVGAFGPAGYDVPRCVTLLDGPAGDDCLSGGCLARRACPVAPAAQYGPAQAAFHMAAFHTAQGGCRQ
jgi:hypothetical protein